MYSNALCVMLFTTCAVDILNIRIKKYFRWKKELKIQ